MMEQPDQPVPQDQPVSMEILDRSELPVVREIAEQLVQQVHKEFPATLGKLDLLVPRVLLDLKASMEPTELTEQMAQRDLRVIQARPAILVQLD